MKKLNAEQCRIIERNIPEAVRLADAEEAAYKKKHGNLRQFEGWNAVYHRAMDELCKKDGVRV